MLHFRFNFSSSEQQYRLHRLLAYDPHNECRGIFSDWFRFPSCCICRCYNIPFEYRVTSRSPRSLDKNFKNDEDSFSADENERDSDDWYAKKSFLNEDIDEMFNDDIEF